MKPVEALLFWVTTGAYVAAFALSFLGLVLGRDRWAAIGLGLTAAGLVAHTAAVAARWTLAGHLPVGNRYELNLSGTWLAVLLVGGVIAKVPRLRALLSGALAPVVLALGLGITSERGLGPLSPAYDSFWLVVHVIFAFLAFGCFALAFSAAVFYLLEDGGVRHRFSERLPALRELDLFGYRMVAAGFVFEAVMIMTGAIWANDLWGSYWSWDPVEVWSLVSLLVYALYLHLRAFRGWAGRRSALLAVAGLVFVFLSFWGVQWLVPTVHDFNTF
ncbi:MAG: c-type cytochrome biogenesis protein CcsB [Thermoleophilia bacterium]